MTTPFGYRKAVSLSFSEAVAKVRDELTKEGFGVITEIDVKDTFKKKLDVDYGKYIILGACNPPSALKALGTEKGIGLFLPCNVIVYSEGEQTRVAAIIPTVAMGMIENPELHAIATDIGQRLERVIAAI